MRTFRTLLTRHWQFLIALAVIGVVVSWVIYSLGAPGQDIDLLQRRAESAHRLCNYAEGLFWLVVGTAMLYKSRTTRGVIRWPQVTAAILCLAFAGSDFVEVHKLHRRSELGNGSRVRERPRRAEIADSQRTLQGERPTHQLAKDPFDCAVR